MKTAVLYFNIYHYLQLTGVLYRVKGFNIVLGMIKEKTLGCMYNLKSPNYNLP